MTFNIIPQTSVVSSTFGPAKRAKPCPANFLRKGSGRLLPVPRSQEGGCKQENEMRGRLAEKPAVPSREEKPIMGLKTCKNFITANAVEAILSEPRKIDKENVDFMEKEGYGKVPDYLDRVKGEVQRENELVDQYVRDQMRRNEEVDGDDEFETLSEKMSEEERKDLIDSLKCRWDHVNSKYQKICHRVAIETLGDKKRKEAQEAELQQLEEDIEKLSRPGPVLIRR